MKASVFQGKNLSKICYSFCATFKFYDCVIGCDYSSPFSKFFNRLKSIKTLTHSIEKSSHGLPNHAHALIEVTGDEKIFLSEIEKKLKPKKVIKGTRVQIVKFLKDKNDIKNEVNFKDKFIEIYFTKFICKKMEIYIEKIVGIENSSYYTMKNSDWGLNTNTLIR